jgi:hypothetical protein
MWITALILWRPVSGCAPFLSLRRYLHKVRIALHPSYQTMYHVQSVNSVSQSANCALQAQTLNLHHWTQPLSHECMKSIMSLQFASYKVVVQHPGWIVGVKLFPPHKAFFPPTFCPPHSSFPPPSSHLRAKGPTRLSSTGFHLVSISCIVYLKIRLCWPHEFRAARWLFVFRLLHGFYCTQWGCSMS